MFDPFLVKMGPVAVMALFLALAALAMAPAVRELVAASLGPVATIRRRLVRRWLREREQAQLWLRHHTPCAVFGGMLAAGGVRAWLRR